MSDHEQNRAAFEALYRHHNSYDASQNVCDHIQRTNEIAWEAWCRALDYAASRECVWTGFSTHGRTHYRTCRGILNYTEMPRLQFIPFCPGCGGRVKIEQQNVKSKPRHE